jgi:C-terminal processing protease CtpA/Prc
MRSVVMVFAVAFAAACSSSGGADDGPVQCPAEGQALFDLTLMRDSVNRSMAYPLGGGVSADQLYDSLRADAAAATTPAAHLHVLEQFVYQMGDHHAHLGTSSKLSPRLVPTSATVWAEMQGGNLVVSEVRPGSAARNAGLREGMVIDRIDGASPEALTPPPSIAPNVDAMRGFAARVVLAGTHVHDAEIVAHGPDGDGVKASLSVAASVDGEEPATLSWPVSDVAVIRINNRMGDDALPPVFSALMREAKKARAIILDLRDTPSGGDSSIAKPVMSWFVDGTKGYQTHQRGAKIWTEKVKGRPDRFRGKLIVLVDHWTGSMGEGTAIGLRAAAGATVVGTQMAGLRGAIESVNLPCLKAQFRFPVERLFEVGGGPRELAQPDVLVTEAELAAGTSGEDAILKRALELTR